MDMVFIVFHCFEVDFWVVLSNFEQFPFQVCKYIVIEYVSSVFGRKDNMVITEVYAVVISSIVIHALSIAWRGDAGTDSIPALTRGVLRWKNKIVLFR